MIVVVTVVATVVALPVTVTVAVAVATVAHENRPVGSTAHEMRPATFGDSSQSALTVSSLPLCSP